MKTFLTAISILFIATPVYSKTYTIDRVIAGDIIKLTNGKVVRLLGIDTPETGTYVEEIGLTEERVEEIKKEARDYLADYVSKLPDKKIFLEFDIEKIDKYSESKRWQAYMFWDTGISQEKIDVDVGVNQHFDYYEGHYKHFINATMVKAGYAIPLPFEPNVKYRDLFEGLHQEAKKNKRGLWTEQQTPKEQEHKEPSNGEKEEDNGMEAEEKELDKGGIIEQLKIDKVVKQTASENDKSKIKKPAREEKEYYDNGTLKLHMVLFDEESSQGFWREYYENGALKIDAKLLLIKGGCSDEGSIPIEGLAREFYMNGQLKQMGHYKNNCEEGAHKHYSKEGILEKETYFEKGKHLQTIHYEANGHVYSEDYMM